MAQLRILSSLLLLLTFVIRTSAATGAEKPEQASIEAGIEAEPAVEVLSSFERYISSMTGSRDLKQFGYDLYKNPPATFAPADNVPVGPDYLLGPGDELNISIWGKVTANYVAVIDHDGKIAHPQMGVLHISGFTLKDARGFLEQELSRHYRPAEVRMNLSMGRLRSIRVFVLGKAAKPGSYTVSSFSTLTNALFSSGGPGKNGSMRDIQVKRNGKTIANFDMYDLLLKGDKSRDIRLMPEDVIFIPPVGKLAAVGGKVKAPGIYELKGEVSARELIDMAGGLEDIAYGGRIKVDRIADNNRETVFESNLEKIKLEDIKILPGDLLSLFPVVKDTRTVRLAGAVLREDDYGVEEGMKVRDIITLAGGLRYYAYTEEAELSRLAITQEGPKTVISKLNLRKALEGDPEHNIELKPNDYLFIKAVPEWDAYKEVNILGEVRFPGVYRIQKGERLSSVIERAGGFTEKAYLKGAVFTREKVRELQQRQLDEAIGRFEEELYSESVRSVEAALSPEELKIQEQAAKQRNALLNRMKAAKAKGRVSINLAAEDEFKGSSSDLALEPGDALFIPAVPAEVQVMGSVYNQNAFVYDSAMSVKSYIGKAGGLKKKADKEEIYLLKADGTAVSGSEKSAWQVNWDSRNNRWVSGDLLSSGLDPGDTIVVPEKIDDVVWMREVKDLTQILYQIAVTAGVLIVAF